MARGSTFNLSVVQYLLGQEANEGNKAINVDTGPLVVLAVAQYLLDKKRE